MGNKDSKPVKEKHEKQPTQLRLYKSTKDILPEIISDIVDIENQDATIIDQIRALPKEVQLAKFTEGPDGYSILHFATKAFRHKLITFLLKDLSFDVNTLSKSGETALHVLITSTLYEETKSEEEKLTLSDIIFKILVKFKIKINIQDEKGFTALHQAVLGKSKELTMMLVHSTGINLNLEDRRSLTPLQLSCRNETDQITNLLIENTDVEQLVKPSPANFPLHLIARSKTEKINLIELIMKKLEKASSKKGAKNYVQIALREIDLYKMPLMHIAVEYGHLTIVETLFSKYKADKNQIDGSGNHLLHLVAKSGSMKLFDILEKYQALTSAQNNKLDTPLHIASYFNNVDFVVKYLGLENKATIESSTPSIQTVNKIFFTPLQVAIAQNNQKVFDKLIKDPNAKLFVKASNGSVYHVCSEYSNIIGLKYLLNNQYSKNPSMFTTKNRNQNTILHLASNLEVVKIIYETLKNSSSLEQFLFAKNNYGQIFFHVACVKGYVPIVEYFLKELKMIMLLEQLDNNLNTPLHLATYEGHASIVSMILDSTSNLKARNNENLTAFELSCRKGYSQISKNIILVSEEDSDDNDFPLHVACAEGATEIVEVLLERGTPIDLLNNEGKNCLDIAIENEQESVIKILLNDPNWKKLFRETNVNEKNNDLDSKDIIENPQYAALFDAKMWEIYEIILSKCVDLEANEIDFSIFDRPCKSKKNHPLMFCARSGQENIIKHEACLLLLKLKWRFVPRFVYYLNLLVSTVFLFLAVLWCFNFKEQSETNAFNFTLYIAITVVVVMNSLKTIIEFILTDKIAYFLSLENTLEILTYVTIMVAINSGDNETQINFGSIAILSAFLSYPLYLQKLRVLGVYVVAVMKTLKNSLKFFPIFLILCMGFVLTFFLRYDTIKLSNNNGANFPFTVIKTIGMAFGDFSTVDDFNMDAQYLNINWVVYLIFLILICVVIFNLFVGIAVSDITAVLGEADVRFLSMRIVFSLKMERIVEVLTKRSEIADRFLSMNYMNFKTESAFVQNIHKKKEVVFKVIKSNEESVNLLDPQKQLEDLFKRMFKSSGNDTENLEKLFKSKIDSLEFKLAESNRKIYGNLLELSNMSDVSFGTVRQDLHSTNTSFYENFTRIEAQIKGLGENIHTVGAKHQPILLPPPPPPPQLIEVKQPKSDNDDKMLMNNLNEKFATIEDQMKELNQKLEYEIIDLKSQMSFFIKSLDDSLRNQTNEIQNALFLSESSIRTDLNETGKVIGKGFIFTKDSINLLNNKLNDMRNTEKGGKAYEQPLPALPGSSEFSAVEVDMPASATSTSKLVKPSPALPKDKNKRK